MLAHYVPACVQLIASARLEGANDVSFRATNASWYSLMSSGSKYIQHRLGPLGMPGVYWFFTWQRTTSILLQVRTLKPPLEWLRPSLFDGLLLQLLSSCHQPVLKMDVSSWFENMLQTHKSILTVEAITSVNGIIRKHTIHTCGSKSTINGSTALFLDLRRLRSTSRVSGQVEKWPAKSQRSVVTDLGLSRRLDIRMS